MFAARNHGHSEIQQSIRMVEELAATPPAVSGGSAAVPALGIGGSTTVAVTINPAMPDASYDATAFIGNPGVGVLSSIAVTGYTVVSNSRVDVTVKNNGLILLTGATVLVLAVRQS